jgi:putative SOS response-associated peptidase YedK
MNTVRQIREQQQKLIYDARALLDELKDHTPAARAREIEAQHDRIMAEHDRIEQRADGLKARIAQYYPRQHFNLVNGASVSRGSTAAAFSRMSGPCSIGLLLAGAIAPIFGIMCGRVVQSSETIRLKILDGIGVPDSRERKPRWNGAPSQDFLVIRRNPDSGAITLDPLRWGLIPHWCKDEKGGQRPINAKAETVATLPSFREAYKKRRCLLPIDAFYEWQRIPGSPRKQPYAIAMKDREPFCLAGIWENWQRPDGEWLRTFAVITTAANELVADIHNRMPAVIGADNYDRWLSEEPKPADLLEPYAAEEMIAWPVSTRVNSPRNDDEELWKKVLVIAA